MRQIAALVLILCGLCGSGMCQYSAVFSSYHGDKRFDFRITPEQLAKTPAWLGNQDVSRVIASSFSFRPRLSATHGTVMPVTAYSH